MRASCWISVPGFELKWLRRGRMAHGKFLPRRLARWFLTQRRSDNLEASAGFQSPDRRSLNAQRRQCEPECYDRPRGIETPSPSPHPCPPPPPPPPPCATSCTIAPRSWTSPSHPPPAKGGPLTSNDSKCEHEDCPPPNPLTQARAAGGSHTKKLLGRLSASACSGDDLARL